MRRCRYWTVLTLILACELLSLAGIAYLILA